MTFDSPDAMMMDKGGFSWARQFTPRSVLNDLERGVSEIEARFNRAGVRDLMKRCPAVRTFARSSLVLDFLERLLAQRPFAVRGILFDKTPEANWCVAWHQDLTIAVRERREAPGYGPWSVKEGVSHVQPPSALLERMVTLRLHLDGCDENSGALWVIPGSHRRGKLNPTAIAEAKERGPVKCCAAQRGDALLMRPLLLHASSSANPPRHRRVIHLEYAVDELPDGLAWAERISE